MRIYAILTLNILVIACRAQSAEQTNEILVEITEDNIKTILWKILLDLNELKEVTTELKQSTDSLHEKTDRLEYAALYLGSRIDKLEDTVEEHEQKHLELEYSIQSNVTELHNQDEVIQNEVQEHESKLMELEYSIQSNVTELHNQDEIIQNEVQDVEEHCQQGYNELNATISLLEQQLQDIYQEAKEDECIIIEGYRYEISPGYYHTWQEGRDYCQSIGGDLAYHGLNNITNRDEILCNQLQQCDHDENRYIYWGLRKREGAVYQWEYLDGKLAEDEEIMWINNSQRTTSGSDCGVMYAWYEYEYHLLTYSHNCDYCNIMHYALCEIAV